MRLSELFSDVEHTLRGEDVSVTALTYDSRKVEPGSLFAALPGATLDGHGFIDDALKRGATAILSEKPVPTNVSLVLVSRARHALARAARTFNGAPDDALTMVGITGTNGKTTVAHLVQSIFAADDVDSATLGTLGLLRGEQVLETGLTTPESVELAEILGSLRGDGVQAVVMEVSSHALDQQRVAGVSYDAAVFTNLSRDHLDYHGTMDAYFEAKSRLFHERMKPGGARVINVDDPRGRELAGRFDDPWTFSASGGDARVRCKEVTANRDGLLVSFEVDHIDYEFRSPLLGMFNVENMLAAATVGIALGMSRVKILEGLFALKAIAGRLERVSGGNEPLVVVDYAHTPDALMKSLSTLRQLVSGRVLCVMGCGGDRDPGKRVQMGRVAGSGSDRLWITNDNPRGEDPGEIAEAIDGGAAETGVERSIVLDRKEAIRQAIVGANVEDVVLIAGKGHEDYQIIGTERHHFDDREVAKEVLKGG
ncbi:MAG: UDP-N-acetylmuramoyl-L-alanyl-D-glutamate--2,6-diaminopimelate ligase [Myxococcota bacterium]